MLTLDYIESTDSGSDVNADAGREFVTDLQAGGFHCLICGGYRQMDEARHLLQFFFVDELQRIEILDLGRDLAGEIGAIELCNAGNAALRG